VDGWIATAPSPPAFTRLEKNEEETAANLARPVIELPKLLRDYRQYSLGTTSFNRVRAACQAFARDNGGRESTLWKEITNTKRYKEEPLRGYQRHYPLEVSELARLVEALDEDNARAVLSMSLTGMGPTEYWGRWEDEGGHISIHGEKRKGRDREILRLVKPWKPGTFSLDVFRRNLPKVGRSVGLPVRPYDLRRTFARLLESAGVVRSNCSAYMGHGPKGMFDLYTHADAERFIKRDAEMVRQHLAPLDPHLIRLGLFPG
jgi:integrase